MPWKIKITGPGVNDFEFVWEDTPTELPPVDLPVFPRMPSVETGPDDIQPSPQPDTSTAPPPSPTPQDAPSDAPAATATQAVPSPSNIDRIIEQALPSKIRPTTSEVPPEEQPPPPPPPAQAPPPVALDAVDSLFPKEIPTTSMIGEEPIPTEQQPAPEPEPVPSMQPLRQLYAATVSAPASMYDLGALAIENLGMPAATAGAVAAGGGQVMTDPNSPLAATTNFLRRAGESARQQTRDWFGATEVPPDVGSRITRNIGEALVPTSRALSTANALKATGIISGVNSAVGEARNLAKTHSLTDFEVPPEWVSGGLVQPAMAAPNQFDQPASGNKSLVESVGGTKKVKTSELWAVGSIVLATAGMVLGPRIYRRFASGDLPALRPVREAPAGTMAISKPGDLARTYDDANAGAMRLLRRTGIDPVAAHEVDMALRIQTRATANAMADSAINVGRMETPSFTFQSRVPLASLSPLESQPARDYLHIMDTLDDLRQRSIHMMNRRLPGTPTVRGHDIVSAGAVRRSLEAAHPEVVQIAREYWDITRNLRNFEATGEYATVTRTQNAFLKRSRQHEVPMHPRVTGDPNVERGSAVEALADDMRNRIRARLENEAKGMYIDAARRQMPNLFTQVTAEQLTENPHWRKNVVEIFRRGNRERWVTDPFLADVLRMDPYYITGNLSALAYQAKRWLEVTTTGELAPWFAVTSPIRSWGIGKFTVEEGMRSPTLMGTVAAVPRQLIPQMSGQIAQRLENGSGGWLGRVFGQQNVQALSARLANAYYQSLWYELQTVGGGRGSILQQQTAANNRLSAAIRSTQGFGRQFLEGYRSLLNSMHNAAAYDYYRRNRAGFRTWSQMAMGRPSTSRNMSLPELASRTRNMTGDPRIGGEFYTRLPQARTSTPIRFENDESRVSHTLGVAARTYGRTTEFGRASIPWYNATVQGVKRLGESYLDNPTKFTARAWLYYIAPTASLYMGTKMLGNDPNGRSYTDYMMNGRTEYNKIMNWYIPIPGRPAEEGIEFPRFHEMTAAAYMTQVAMDHAVGDPVFTQPEDMRKGATAIADILLPPPPAGYSWAAAHMGKVAPQGWFGGEPYTPYQDPFDQLGGMDKSLELYARAIAPGVADVVGAGYAAATQSPEGYLSKMWTGFTAGLKRIGQKAPVVRNILGLTPPASGNTQVMEELFAKKKELSQLNQYFKAWTDRGGLVGADKPASATGEVLARRILGDRPTRESAGIDQPRPTNPLYLQFMDEVHNTFSRDAVRGGGIGFKSAWQRFDNYTEQIRRLRKVNDGNQVTWEQQMEGREAQKATLKAAGINYKDVRAVRNFYERKRQEVARVLLTTIRDVEDKMSRQIGRKITLKDLDPYKAGLKDAPPVTDTLDLPTPQ